MSHLDIKKWGSFQMEISRNEVLDQHMKWPNGDLSQWGTLINTWNGHMQHHTKMAGSMHKHKHTRTHTHSHARAHTRTHTYTTPTGTQSHPDILRISLPIKRTWYLNLCCLRICHNSFYCFCVVNRDRGMDLLSFSFTSYLVWEIQQWRTKCANKSLCTADIEKIINMHLQNQS